jgi:hypothetical protein
MTINQEYEFICIDCGNSFTYNPGNSTIKKKRCPLCQKKYDSNKRIEYNKKLLAQSTLIAKNKQSGQRTFKYKSGLKRLKMPRQKAMKLADKYFSIYIRIKYNYTISNGEVFCQCIINPKIIKNAKSIDNGHCFSRNYKSIRYEEDNCRPQNRSSNRYSGEADHYKFIENLKKQIGEERFERLERLKDIEINDNESFYREQADKYLKLINEMADNFEINKWW